MKNTKQALYLAYRDFLEAPQDLSQAQVGHSVVASQRIGPNWHFYRVRIDRIVYDTIVVNFWSGQPQDEQDFDLQGRAYGTDKRYHRLYLPDPRFRVIFKWQEAIAQLEDNQEGTLRYLSLRDRERYYLQVLTLPMQSPGQEQPLVLQERMPDRSRQELMTFITKHCNRPQPLERVRSGQHVVWEYVPRHSLPQFISTKVARSTKKSLFVRPDEETRQRWRLEDKEICFDRQGYRRYRKGERWRHDRLFLPHQMFDYLAYVEALRRTIGITQGSRIHLASYDQITDLLSLLNSFPSSWHYYEPFLTGLSSQ